MMSSDNSNLLNTFWKKTQQLDDIRQENWRIALPELQEIYENTPQ